MMGPAARETVILLVYTIIIKSAYLVGNLIGFDVCKHAADARMAGNHRYGLPWTNTSARTTDLLCIVARAGGRTSSYGMSCFAQYPCSDVFFGAHSSDFANTVRPPDNMTCDGQWVCHKTHFDPYPKSTGSTAVQFSLLFFILILLLFLHWRFEILLNTTVF